MKRILAFLLFAITAQLAIAQNFTNGNIVVARLGDGTQATNTGAMPVTLLEFNPTTKALTNTINIPSTTAGQRLLINANSAAGANEGGISLSADGRYIVIGGADVPVSPISTNTGPAFKSFARINMAGNVDVFTINGTLNGSSNGFIRATASTDGNSLIFTGGFGTGYVAWGNTTATAFNFSTTGSRYVNIIGSKLYSVNSTDPASILYFGNVPTSNATNNGTALVGTNASTVKSGYGFALLDVDNTIANVNDNNDVLYIVDQTAASPGIIKMAYNTVNSNWDFIGKLTTTSPCYGLTARVVGANVELYTVSNFGDDNKLISIVDANSRTTFTAAATTSTIIAYAGTKYVFRSVAFSPYAATLPIKLTSFTAVTTLNGANVKWSTAEEVNVKEMTLLRKEGNGEFKAIKLIKPKGGSTINNYQVDDIGLASGTYYYQLKTTDLDGSESFGKIVTINVKGIGLSVYPNPTSGTLNLQFASVGTNATLKIYNIEGKVMDNFAIAPSSTSKNIDVTRYTAGNYLVKLSDNGKLQTMSFIKQ